jgi:hypothetical protein
MIVPLDFRVPSLGRMGFLGSLGSCIEEEEDDDGDDLVGVQCWSGIELGCVVVGVFTREMFCSDIASLF